MTFFPDAELIPFTTPAPPADLAAPTGEYDAWVVAATPAELSWAVSTETDEVKRAVGRPLWGEAYLGELRLALVSTGVGPVNTALALGALGAMCSTGLIVNCGVAGAYPGSGLSVGQLAVATEEIDADTGIESTTVSGTVLPLPIPLHRQNKLRFGRYPLDPNYSERLEKVTLSTAGARHGPFVTSATVTATAERAALLEESYGALCENMEGAAVARAALELGAKMVEVRGISNIAGPRDRDSWKLEEAIEVSGRAVKLFLTELAEQRRGR